MVYTLEFERPVRDLDDQIRAIEEASGMEGGTDASRAASATLRKEIASLKKSRRETLRKVYGELSPWDTVRVARHPERPQTRDYIELMVKDFAELHGDRRYGDDAAMVTGFGRIGPHKVMVVGQHKGRDTSEKVRCNFGCAHPEGYRKALAKMKLAEKFGVPVVTLVDTPGAFPGIGAEERGQSEAIAVNLREMSRLRVPIVSVLIGEGGSGGALGIAVSDRVGMLEFAYYSVISPEGCAAILWKEANAETNRAAADALCLTARANKRLGVVDKVIREPVGGAHREPSKAAESIERFVVGQLGDLREMKPETLVSKRYERFRRQGAYSESAAGA